MKSMLRLTCSLELVLSAEFVEAFLSNGDQLLFFEALLSGTAQAVGKAESDFDVLRSTPTTVTGAGGTVFDAERWCNVLSGTSTPRLATLYPQHLDHVFNQKVMDILDRYLR